MIHRRRRRRSARICGCALLLTSMGNPARDSGKLHRYATLFPRDSQTPIGICVARVTVAWSSNAENESCNPSSCDGNSDLEVYHALDNLHYSSRSVVVGSYRRHRRQPDSLVDRHRSNSADLQSAQRAPVRSLRPLARRLDPANFIFIPMAVIRTVRYCNTSWREQSWGGVLSCLRPEKAAPWFPFLFFALRDEAIAGLGSLKPIAFGSLRLHNRPKQSSYACRYCHCKRAPECDTHHSYQDASAARMSRQGA